MEHQKQKTVGAWGEQVAAKALQKKGYFIRDRNFSCRFGEIDLIAENQGYLVFVEVKTRKNADFATGAEAVTFAKQRRIIRTAEYWLLRHANGKQPRFDVIEVYIDAGMPVLRHLENAFTL